MRSLPRSVNQSRHCIMPVEHAHPSKWTPLSPTFSLNIWPVVSPGKLSVLYTRHFISAMKGLQTVTCPKISDSDVSEWQNHHGLGIYISSEWFYYPLNCKKLPAKSFARDSRSHIRNIWFADQLLHLTPSDHILTAAVSLLYGSLIIIILYVYHLGCWGNLSQNEVGPSLARPYFASWNLSNDDPSGMNFRLLRKQ